MSELPAAIGPIDIYRTIHKDGAAWTARLWSVRNERNIYSYGDTPEQAVTSMLEELRNVAKEHKESTDE